MAGTTLPPAYAVEPGDATRSSSGTACPAPSIGWARQVPGNGCNAKNNLFSAVNRQWVHISYVLVDLVLISLSGLVAFTVRFTTVALLGVYLRRSSGLPMSVFVKEHFGFLLLYAILIVLVFQSQDLYRTPRERPASEETWEVIRSVGLATIVLAAFIFCTNVKVVSREVVGICAGLNIALLASWRLWKRHFVSRRVEQGMATRNALIIGSDKTGQALARQLEANKHLGYRFSGFLDSYNHSEQGLLGKLEDLPSIARAKFIDEVFVTASLDRDLLKRVTNEAKELHLNVKVVPDIFEGLTWNTPVRLMGSLPVLELHRVPSPSFGLFVKRLVDVILSGITLVILSPFFLLVAIAIKLDSPGDVFHRAKRIGEKGVPFICYKFRSMIQNAEKRKGELGHLNERSNGLLFKIKDDPRITRMGQYLRKYSLDELPQLWNVLKGDMSLVGPRPPLPIEFESYSLEHFRRLDVKPGLTGLWQVTARRDPSFEQYMNLDLEYIQKWSLWLDLKIVLMTLPVVFRGEGS